MWRFERRTFHIGSMGTKLILAFEEMDPKLIEHGKLSMQNNQLPTKTMVELMDNSNNSPIMLTIESRTMTNLNMCLFGVCYWIHT